MSAKFHHPTILKNVIAVGEGLEPPRSG